MEGLWYMHFYSGPIQGDGLAVLQNGELLGGDPAHTYDGSYQLDGTDLYANIRVSPYAAARQPDLDRPITMFLKGSVTGDSAVVTGHPDRHEELRINVELHRALQPPKFFQKIH